MHDRRPNATIRFYTWRRRHAEMQRFQAQHDTAHCSGSDADVGSAASAGAHASEDTCSALSARHTSLLERGPDGEDLLRGEDRKPQL